MRFFPKTSASARVNRHRLTTAARLLLVIGALAVVQSSAMTRADAGSVTISPELATLAPGEQRQFTAATSGNGRVHWRATGGKISTEGVYTAGAETGSFTVTAAPG